MVQTVAVTGATGGIGLALCEALARRGRRVLLLARDEARGAAALARVRAACGDGPAPALVRGELGSVPAARAAGEALGAACGGALGALVHNAGVWPSRCERDAQGLERAFVVNHLAPYVLDRALTAPLAAARGRVVLVTAGLYPLGRIDLARTPYGDDFSPLRTYANTKRCALLGLGPSAARFARFGVTTYAVHPGVVRTALGDRPGAIGYLLSLVKRRWLSPEEGARAVLRLLDDEPVAAPSGSYFDRFTARPRGPAGDDPALAAALWAQASALTGLAADEPEAPR